MREQPWNTRRTSVRHELWYRDLVDLHSLTLTWLKELNVDQSALRRQAGERIAETLWMLEPLAGTAPSLEKLLDDSPPDDLLDRLEHTVQLIQSWTLIALLEKTPPAQLPAAHDLLAQSSRKAGQECALRRWPRLDDETRRDLRGALAVYLDCPLSGPPGQPAWLLVRAVTNELRLELLSCPHRDRFPETKNTADLLCELRAHWTRGFASALNPRIGIDYKRGDEAHNNVTSRCSMRWWLD